MIREPEREVWSVTELVQYLYDILDLDENLKKIWVEGEITNFSQHSKSRHMYFTLKDEQTAIDAVMFAGNNRRLRFTPKNGDRVLVRGYVSIYMKDGHLQLYVQDMRLSGIGDLYVAFQRLKEQLQAEGLFDVPKKKLPSFPRRVGVITSASGAAVRDIIVTMRRRLPMTPILLYPVSVQGEKAAKEIAEAIDHMNRLMEVDVLIVGRGGGSLEELWAFNEEIVARSIFRSVIPVVSAVGHETDVTISDFVADARAATPTAAAEMVVPHIAELHDRLTHLYKRLLYAQTSLMNRLKERLHKNVDRPIFTNPNARLYQYAQHVDSLEIRLQNAMGKLIEKKDRQLEQRVYRLTAFHPQRRVEKEAERLELLKRDANWHLRNLLKDKAKQYQHLLAKLDSLSPLKVMLRGYSLVYRHDGKTLVKSYRQAAPGDLIHVRLAEGQLKCQVWKSEETENE
ncbi:exodeoxyribonuclease VII large subunit [Thermoactinomyces daqus]|uniref:Exodeoxyribonuclease 7 large subunit n=1 Tax=Thermoactinomyces daqus TaxID=1329516 RepID=A0A7W2AHP6_9BACL|nr:exodeoxyribonuclease VII large subunit [Thermoactinomyces daqus]MBA4542971.1 exodeoxyribonuclease VII large subunit [Thermoactinomyces daqus]